MRDVVEKNAAKVPAVEFISPSEKKILFPFNPHLSAHFRTNFTLYCITFMVIFVVAFAHFNIQRSPAHFDVNSVEMGLN